MHYGCDLLNKDKVELKSVKPIFEKKNPTFGKLTNECMPKHFKIAFNKTLNKNKIFRVCSLFPCFFS